MKYKIEREGAERGRKLVFMNGKRGNKENKVCPCEG